MSEQPSTQSSEQPSEPAPTEWKRRTRAAVRARRDAMTAEQRAEAAVGLAERMMDLVTARGARSVSCYLPVGGEPNTRPFIAQAREHGVEVLLPSSRGDGLLDWIRDTGAGIEIGAYGIPEPVGERLDPLAVAHVDLMLIPACAVDERGVRLGWGRGYFDRCLAAMDRRPAVFAVVHTAELLPELPSEPHDIPVDGVVTPQRTVLFG